MLPYFSGRRKVPGIILLVHLLFLAVYYSGLRERLLLFAANQPIEMDKQYYQQIFVHLGYAAFIVAVLLLLCIVFMERIVVTVAQWSRRPEKLLWYGLAAGCSLGIMTVISLQTKPIADAGFYVAQSEILYKTGEYRSAAGYITAYWPVGLPFLLAVLHHCSEQYILVMQFINVGVLAGLIYVSYRLFEDELQGRQKIVFILCFALFPNNILSANVILTDYPSTMLLYAISFILLKKGLHWLHIGISAVLLAASAYLRPTNILMLLPLTLLLLKMLPLKERYGKVFAFAAVVFVCVLPWGIRNYQAFHGIVPMSSNGGFNFLMGNHKDSWGRTNFNFTYNDKNTDELEESRKAYSQAFQDIAGHPVKSILRIPLKLCFALMRGDSSVIWAMKSTNTAVHGLLLALVFLVTNGFYYFLIATAVLALAKKRMHIGNGYLRFFLQGVAFFFILLIVIYVGADRYLIPLYPVIIFASAKFFNPEVQTV